MPGTTPARRTITIDVDELDDLITTVQQDRAWARRGNPTPSSTVPPPRNFVDLVARFLDPAGTRPDAREDVLELIARRLLEHLHPQPGQPYFQREIDEARDMVSQDLTGALLLLTGVPHVVTSHARQEDLRTRRARLHYLPSRQHHPAHPAPTADPTRAGTGTHQAGPDTSPGHGGPAC